MQELISDFVARKVWAVVGFSRDSRKFGNIVFHDLRNAGYRVYPVNPKYKQTDGIRVYPSLSLLPEKPDVVGIVVPPSSTEQVVKECLQNGIFRVWMQPGAESEVAIRFCREHGLQVVSQACILVQRKQWD